MTGGGACGIQSAPMRATVVRGAKTHNLKGVDLALRPGELVAFTGPSGAGKSSLAIDTIYAEGQRRFVESFSPYARQFLERLDRPPVDALEPVAAGVAVDRRAPIKSSRSTVATMAELEPYLAALFSREAVPRCPEHDVPAVVLDADSATSSAIARGDGGRALVSYPVRVESAEHYLVLREELARDGVRRLRVGGAVTNIDEVKPSVASGAEVEVIVDRLRIEASERPRLREGIERAFDKAGVARVIVESSGVALTFGKGLACPVCARGFSAPRPGLFSYNQATGACATCRGFGRTIGIDWEKVIPDPSKSIAQGAIKAWAGKSAEWERKSLVELCKKRGIPLDVPWSKLPASVRTLIVEGDGVGWDGGGFGGLRAWFRWLETRTYKMHVRVFLARYRAYETCPSCGGSRLNEEARRYEVDGLGLSAWHALSVDAAHARLAALAAHDAGGARAAEVLATRLAYLRAVGLGHLALDRPARTLSGGEAQRVGLTSALGTSLVGALFVVDEPTVGLHPTDVPPLVEALKTLARAGNIVVVIEHDPTVIRACDRVIELGPAAGPDGGQVLFDGTPAELAARVDLPTGKVVAGDRSAAPKSMGRQPHGELRIVGAEGHNLHSIDVRIPLGVLCAVSGPSGSGKSSLVGGILAPAAARRLGETGWDPPLPHARIEGLERIEHVVFVDQAPLGRTSRGNAATYTKAWDHVRALFATAGERLDGAEPPPAGHFSFNTEGGRCEACTGEGFETVEMQFLADVAILCPVCRGRRFQPRILEVSVRGKNVADLLEMTVAEVLAWSDAEHAAPGSPSMHIARALTPLVEVGLGYLPLGQPLSTLSGGEAQRLKLSRALVEVPTHARPVSAGGRGKAGGPPAEGYLVIVDEPSAGLHARDVALVVSALSRLVERGASVVVVEHDLDVLAAADHVIDLGPGGGAEGGRVVAEGPPAHVAETDTRTGRVLAAHAFAAKRAKASRVVERRASSAKASETARAEITIEHAREHNLRDVSVHLPHGKLVVLTGPSGSGKSTLAFDVVFAEGQRRFLETLSPYARQFLPTLPRPDVERVLGVPPSIALEQRTTRGGRTSTVATVTEAAHYLRLLFAKVGTPHCPKCETEITAVDPETIARRIGMMRGPVTVFARAVRARKGTHLDVFTRASRAGYREARVDGERVAIDPPPTLARSKEHTIELVAAEGDPSTFPLERFIDALGRGDGEIVVESRRGAPLTFSTKRSCPKCQTGVPELDPRWFSFNTQQGRCATCEGAGVLLRDPEDETTAVPCKVCGGSRLGPVPRRVRLGGETYHSLTERSVDAALARIGEIERPLLADGAVAPLAKAPLAELQRRLAFLSRVGLGYLSLDRPARTLSGGEMQRLRLAAQLGSGLTGALYVLDEPTIGLHPRDTHLLLENLRALVDTGSSVLVVEHDVDTIRAADWVIDLGPTGGSGGGAIVAAGTPAEVLAHADSPTARAFAHHGTMRAPKRDGRASKTIGVTDARGHNLAGVDFEVPVGRMTVVAGVSGSGKSTLVRQVFYPAVRRALGLEAPPPLPFGKVVGHRHVARALSVDQSPIGKSPRSTPATFLGIWDHIRKLYAAAPEAQVRGFSASRFSYNTKGGGRCPTCEGAGIIVSEMSFLPDVSTPCESCGGLRFDPATLEIRWLGKSVGEVLAMSASEGAAHFAAHPAVARPLQVLDDLGVGYVQLGQGSHTLSGGEAQRLKLASELAETARHQPTLYVLDEPTTGLHLGDVRKLIAVLERLVDRGDTLVVIEHHPDVIAAADHLVELGPDGGARGGRIVATGTPDEVARKKTATGKELAALGLGRRTA